MKLPNPTVTHFEVLPCPFCGSDTALEWNFDEGEYRPDELQIVCSINKNGCGASSRYSQSAEVCVKAWNLRAEQ